MIIDGKKIAQRIISELAEQVERLSFQPVFCDVVVGNDPVSLSYVNLKGKMAERLGLKFVMAQFPETITTAELQQEINTLNQFPNMCGVIVQLPLPAGIDRQAVLDSIDPSLDVDCLSTVVSTRFYEGGSHIVPPTAAAIMRILDEIPEDMQNKKYLVIGQGDLVGKPVTYLLEQRGVTVTTADNKTADMLALTHDADVIISGTGRAGLITKELVHPNVIVIDAGTAETSGGIVGDVQFAEVEQVAAYISPVPGGVGPVTVAMLFSNVMAVAGLKK